MNASRPGANTTPKGVGVRVPALEIADGLEAALSQFNRIAARLTRDAPT
jgi:hypothetical protein